MISFLNKECGVLRRNRWKRALVGRPLVLLFLIIAWSEMVAEKSDVTLTLSGRHDGSLVGLILLLGLKKGRLRFPVLGGHPCLEELINCALGLLANLETVHKVMSMLLRGNK